MATTIKDVARLAGVSASTVSRVLDGSTRISPETHEKVRRAMAELHYHPNAIARSLARRSTRTLGLVISRPVEVAFANPFFAEAVRGIGAAVYQEGYNLLLTAIPDAQEEQAACMKLVRGGRVDGVILTGSRDHDGLVQELSDAGFPFVLIGRVTERVPISWVNNDNVAVGAMAVEHLLERGHRQIALIGGPKELVVSMDRREGYRQALLVAGIVPDQAYESEGGFSREGGYWAMERLLSLPEPPTAVFAADDAMALGALECCKAHGVAVPEQVALVGVNDDPITALLNPPLTTVRIPIFDLGLTAAKTLVEMLQEEAYGPRQIILPSQLVIRASSDRQL